MADFSLLQTPNFGQAALSGYQAGAALGRQRQLDSALGAVDLEKPETLLPVLRADPSTGAALIGASAKMADYKHELAGKAALADYITARSGMTGAPNGGAASVAPSPVDTAANSTASVAPATPAADDGEIVVTAHRDQPDPVASARAALIRSDPEQYLKVEQHFASMTAEQAKASEATLNTFDGVLQGAKGVPYEQRRAWLQQHRADLLASGVPADRIDNFDPSDANITAVDNQVLGYKGILDQQNKAADDARADRSQQESIRHNAVEEGQGAARIGLEGANVAISRGHLALAQHADARAAAGAAAKPAAGGAASLMTRKLPNGVTAYRNPANGKWYDNAAFK
jgi:hypothetical protein